MHLNSTSAMNIEMALLYMSLRSETRGYTGETPRRRHRSDLGFSTTSTSNMFSGWKRAEAPAFPTDTM